MNRLLIAICATFLAVLLVGAGSCIAFYNEANAIEKTIMTEWRSNQILYDTMWKTVAETAQVPEQYKKDFKELIVAENEGKFGEEGSKAVSQWFQERDLKPDPRLYQQVQRVIEAKRGEFTRGQQIIADRQRAYATLLDSVNGAFWSSLTGFPKEIQGDDAPSTDRDKDGRITVLDYPVITSEKTDAVFKSGKENEPMQVF